MTLLADMRWVIIGDEIATDMEGGLMIYAGLCCCDLIFSGRGGKFLWLALSV